MSLADLQPPKDTVPWDRKVMHLNCNQWLVRSNIRNNIRRHLPQMKVHETSPQRIAIVGGGWSLNETIEELRDVIFRGAKIIALNGSANWLVEHNFRPSMHIVLDARPVNANFFKYDIPDCKYFLASQCHPTSFEAVEGRDVTIFHVVSTNGELERKRLDNFYNKRWQEVPSSGTVGIVAILLCRLLGFKFQHIFGMDSCYSPHDGSHHAYSQPWNDPEGWGEFWIAGRKFKCSAWQASQCGEFLDMLKTAGDHVCLDIHGDGALAHILKTGAEMDLASLKLERA